MTQLRNDSLLTVDFIFLMIKVGLFVYFINGKAATPPVSKKVPDFPPEIMEEEEASDVVDGVAKYWRLLFLLRWAFSVISYLVRFEHEETETVFIMDLAQAILIFLDVGLCYVYVTKIIREIPPEGWTRNQDDSCQ